MSKFVTNQNIEIELELGSLGERILAFIIDSAIVFCLIVAISILIQEIGIDDWIIMIFYIPIMFYSLAFEYFGNGQSPGKRAMNLKVVKLDGSTPTIGSYLLRWLFRLLDIYVIYGGVGVLSIMITKNGQRVGDLAANTTVIKIRNVGAARAFKSPANENHVVQFHEVKLLNDEQIKLIKKALKMRKEGFSKEGVPVLAEKIKKKLNIQSDLPDVKFLYTIIADYEFIANQSY